MADLLPKQVYFNPGEPIVEDDFNALQDRMEAHLIDGVYAGRARDLEGQSLPRQNTLWVNGNGGAVWAPSGLDRTVNFASGYAACEIEPAGSGTLFRGPVTGNTPSLKAAFINGDDIPELTRPTPSTGDRWDILVIDGWSQVVESPTSRDFKDATTGALSTSTPNKTRRAQFNYTWIQGTDGGGIPSIPIGQVPICACLVPLAASPIDTETGLIDYRMPVGFRAHHMNARQLSGAFWTRAESSVDGDSLSVSSPGTNAAAIGFIPVADALHRLQKVDVMGHCTQPLDNTVTLQTKEPGGGISTIYTLAGVGITYDTYQVRSFNVTSSVLWSNGYKAGYAAEQAGLAKRQVFCKFQVVAGSSVASCTGMTFYIHGD